MERWWVGGHDGVGDGRDGTARAMHTLSEACATAEPFSIIGTAVSPAL